MVPQIEEMDSTMSHETGAPLRVALLGCGVVGSSVATMLLEHADDLAARVGARLELVGIAVRRPQRVRPDVPVDPTLFTSDADELVTRADIVVEVVPGARDLGVGKHMLTLHKLTDQYVFFH